MSGRGVEPLLSELARDLRPVRPIPRLRGVLLCVGLAWLASLAVQGALGGPIPSWSSSGDAPRAGLLAGLALAAAGGVIGALAGAVPGREPLARAALAMLVAGVAWASLAGGLAVLQAGGGSAGWASLGCAARACALAIAPALLAGLFIARACGAGRRSCATLASVGAVALGAVAVQLSCSRPVAIHTWVGHAVVPLLAALILSWPLRGWVRGVARRWGG